MSSYHGRVGRGSAKVAKELRREEAEERNAKTPLEKTRHWRLDLERRLDQTKAA